MFTCCEQFDQLEYSKNLLQCLLDCEQMAGFTNHGYGYYLSLKT